MINNFLLKSFVFFTVFVIFCSFYNAGAFNNEGELLRAVESVRKIEAHAKSQKDFDNVVEEYRKILFKFQGRTFAPTLAVLHFKMADILFDTGKSQEALKELIRIAELYPGTPQSLMAIRRINRAMDSIDTPASENKLKSYIDNQIGYTFYYMNDWWFENKSIADSEVKLFLERKPGAPCAERKFSVMTSKTADITGPETFFKKIKGCY
jgi:tetratricopeptide (TPR) repeat protein